MRKGIVRRLDELGRITLPMEYRRTAGIKPCDRVGIILDGEIIRIVLAVEEKMFIGMDRPVDDMGRISLPMEIRQTLNYSERQKVDMYVEAQEIWISKVGCHFCQSEDDLIEFKGVHICKGCAQELCNQVKE